MPFTTVSKIGTWIVPPVGRATMTSLPPCRGPPYTAANACALTASATAVPLEHLGRVLLARVDENVRAQLTGEFELVIGGSGDLRVLHGQMTEVADAGDRHQLGRVHVGDLKRLVRLYVGTGQRGRVAQDDYAVRAWLRRVAAVLMVPGMRCR
ncbi:hypothetical protein GCM10010285_36570 [Streptomyces pseudogriseolus]|uniref:Uncharacterized protein n=1 Tax=Streptomyces pseudogriseolus TaxID=36817 RepID=A0ABQ2T7Y7_STREZ|nr:hypothetical protein GCM10010285_36570 [Streptomyces rubiginosus]